MCQHSPRIPSQGCGTLLRGHKGDKSSVAVSMVIKALAKYSGHYENMEGGTSPDSRGTGAAVSPSPKPLLSQTMSRHAGLTSHVTVLSGHRLLCHHLFADDEQL